MRTLITAVAIIASLAIGATSAMAANTKVHKSTNTRSAQTHTRVLHTRTAVHNAAPRVRYARAPRYYDVGGIIQSFLGGRWPPVNVKLARSTGRGRGPYVPAWSPPTYDSPTVDYSSGAYQAAQWATDNAAQESAQQAMQSAQEANDAANAAVTAGILAAQQTEIQANN
jgi:hypothetical protein